MGDDWNQYECLSDLFVYPDEHFGGRVVEVQKLLDETFTPAAEELHAFTSYASSAPLVEMEEIYTRSFDVQAITTLDLGYVLFGDDYKRGELLVNLNREHGRAAVDCGTELADHLPNVLRLIAAMDDGELRRELVRRIVAPALRKIMAEFDGKRMDKKDAVYRKHHKTLIDRSEQYGVIYVCAVRALYSVLERDFNVEPDEVQHAPQQGRFLQSIGTEMTMECRKGNCDVANR